MKTRLARKILQRGMFFYSSGKIRKAILTIGIETACDILEKRRRDAWKKLSRKRP